MDEIRTDEDSKNFIIEPIVPEDPKASVLKKIRNVALISICLLFCICFIKEWGNYFIALLGLILVIIGIVQIVKFFAFNGQSQINWLVSLGMIFIGSFLLMSSIGGLLNFATVGHYGCPNSKRINKLNLKRRKMKG